MGTLTGCLFYRIEVEITPKSMFSKTTSVGPWKNHTHDSKPNTDLNAIHNHKGEETPIRSKRKRSVHASYCHPNCAAHVGVVMIEERPSMRIHDFKVTYYPVVGGSLL